MLALLVGLEGARYDAVHKVFVNFAVDIVDMPGKKQRPALYYKIDGHWNPAGHVEAADRLFKKLHRLGIDFH